MLSVIKTEAAPARTEPGWQGSAFADFHAKAATTKSGKTAAVCALSTAASYTALSSAEGRPPAPAPPSKERRDPDHRRPAGGAPGGPVFVAASGPLCCTGTHQRQPGTAGSTPWASCCSSACPHNAATRALLVKASGTAPAPSRHPQFPGGHPGCLRTGSGRQEGVPMGGGHRAGCTSWAGRLPFAPAMGSCAQEAELSEFTS
uniref:Uncharacterized protein n=1 Tax=Molossus molossus TaxID=27622 RepID=A0A7J8HHZ8_MOLMO|nr:hypothetical protein HJG59_010946 [Molossus molossus]